MFAVVTLRDVNSSYEGLGDVGLELFENEDLAEKRLLEIYNQRKEELEADGSELEIDSFDAENKVFSVGIDGEYYSGQVREV